MSQQTVMITGASGNLGRAVARLLAAEGRPLIVVGAHEAGLRSAFGDDRPDCRQIAVDLTDDAACAQKLGAAVSAAGGVGALCALAGGFHMGEPVHELSREILESMLDLNVRTFLNAARAVLPGMIAAGKGNIVSVGASSALRGGADMGAYALAKSGVMRLTESMAAENGRHGVTANAILPTIIDTPENRAAMPKADPARWASPDSIAAVVRFLVSDDAAAINGALIPVPGRG